MIRQFVFVLFESCILINFFSLPEGPWVFQVKTHKAFEETEEIEEIVDNPDISTEEIADEQAVEGINIMIRQGDTLMDLQTFEGFWEWQESLFSFVGVDLKLATELVKEHGWDFRIAATAFAIIFLEEKQAKEKDTWELVVEKAKGWMEEQIGAPEVEVVLLKVAGLVK